ncbi:MAG: hypothetical protein A3G23_02050 [Bacteroidetes bacterium RIFCSPLOWO2_12_FULL_37_12]|nr:MAG: hypothetical protein A3G23_02050 [Bacteroidetes bacterium RIFCSPLOWO2_12_FULL_37_12]
MPTLHECPVCNNPDLDESLRHCPKCDSDLEIFENIKKFDADRKSSGKLKSIFIILSGVLLAGVVFLLFSPRKSSDAVSAAEMELFKKENEGLKNKITQLEKQADDFSKKEEEWKQKEKLALESKENNTVEKKDIPVVAATKEIKKTEPSKEKVPEKKEIKTPDVTKPKPVEPKLVEKNAVVAEKKKKSNQEEKIVKQPEKQKNQPVSENIVPKETPQKEKVKPEKIKTAEKLPVKNEKKITNENKTDLVNNISKPSSPAPGKGDYKNYSLNELQNIISEKKIQQSTIITDTALIKIDSLQKLKLKKAQEMKDSKKKESEKETEKKEPEKKNDSGKKEDSGW